MAWLVFTRAFLLCVPMCFSCASLIQPRLHSKGDRSVGLSDDTARVLHTNWDRTRAAASVKYAALLDSYHDSYPDDNGAEVKWEESLGDSLNCATVQPWTYSPFDDSPCRKQYKMKGNKPAKIWEHCGTGDTDSGANVSSCFCHGRYASCCEKLTSIPKFNCTVFYLNMSFSALSILSDVTLQNVPDLKWLILDNNNISVVTSDAFKNVTSLECLELVNNSPDATISSKNFTSAVNQLPNLKLLSLNYTRFSLVGGEDAGITYVMMHLKSDTLEVLFADGGELQILYLSDVANLPRLRTLSVASHSILNMFMCREDSFRPDEQNLDAAYAYPVSKDPWADVGRRRPKDLLLTGDDDGLSYTRHDANVSAASGYMYNEDRLPRSDVDAASPKKAGSESSRNCSTFSLPNLTKLDMSYNLLVAFPNFCRDNASDGAAAVLPSLTHLSFSLTAIVNPEREQMTCLPSLTSMSLTGAPLRRIKSRAFQGLPKLHDLDLRFTNVMFIEEEAFNHSSLREINIQSSNWFFDIQHASNFDANLFRGSTLTKLDLSYNVFRFVSPDRLCQLLEPLKSLKRLYMAEIGLFVIPDVITSTFRDLEVFWFNANLVSYVPPNTFENLTRLVYLDLRDNLLTNPGVKMLQNLRRGKGRNVTVKVNLAWNPYSCTCDMFPFLQMVRQYRSNSYTPEELSSTAAGLEDDAQLQIVGSEYRCYSPANVYNVTLADLEMTTQMCLLSEEQAIIIHCVCIVVILVICIYSFLYRYRWQVRFWMYSLHVRWNKRQEGQRSHRTRYNAFVSYCPKDSHFVLTKVLPALETSYRLPLCIHERDFVPGRYISQNIVERMEESSHVLLVLSNAFLQDDWCRFELFVAQRYGLIHRKIPVTVLLLEQLHVQLMDAHVIMMIQSRPGLEWPGEETDAEERDTFWKRLGESLKSAEGRPPTSPRNGRAVLARR